MDWKEELFLTILGALVLVALALAYHHLVSDPNFTMQDLLLHLTAQSMLQW